MTPAEIQAETERLRVGVRRLAALVRALGVSEEVREQLALTRRDFADAHARMLAERTKTLRAGLPPPRRGLVLRFIALHLNALADSIAQLDSLLDLEVAA